MSKARDTATNKLRRVLGMTSMATAVNELPITADDSGVASGAFHHSISNHFSVLYRSDLHKRLTDSSYLRWKDRDDVFGGWTSMFAQAVQKRVFPS
jgi:hypothetical protein